MTIPNDDEAAQALAKALGRVFIETRGATRSSKQATLAQARYVLTHYVPRATLDAPRVESDTLRDAAKAVVASRGGDALIEDCYRATVGTDEIIRLEMALDAPRGESPVAWQEMAANVVRNTCIENDYHGNSGVCGICQEAIDNILALKSASPATPPAAPEAPATTAPESEAALLARLDEIVGDGRGEIRIGLTENGGVGLWLPQDTEESKVPEGGSVEEAIRFRLDKEIRPAYPRKPAPALAEADNHVCDDTGEKPCPMSLAGPWCDKPNKEPPASEAPATTAADLTGEGFWWLAEVPEQRDGGSYYIKDHGGGVSGWYTNDPNAARKWRTKAECAEWCASANEWLTSKVEPREYGFGMPRPATTAPAKEWWHAGQEAAIAYLTAGSEEAGYDAAGKVVEKYVLASRREGAERERKERPS